MAVLQLRNMVGKLREKEEQLLIPSHIMTGSQKILFKTQEYKGKY